MNTARKPIIVAITGGSGSGKSWLADRLQWLLGDMAGRISLDDFYRDNSHLPHTHRAALNFDEPDAIEWHEFERMLHAIAGGHPVSVPQYDFHTHNRRPQWKLCEPKPVMLVDGLWLLHRPEVRRVFQLKIYLECPEHIRLRRRLDRDLTERGRSEAESRHNFGTTVAPMHDLYVSPQKSFADIILQPGWTYADIRYLHESLWNHAKAPPVPVGADESGVLVGINESTWKEEEI